MSWIFTHDQVQLEQREDTHYFDTKYFFNDLESPEDYYLKVTSGKENKFVRKDEINDN